MVYALLFTGAVQCSGSATKKIDRRAIGFTPSPLVETTDGMFARSQVEHWVQNAPGRIFIGDIALSDASLGVLQQEYWYASAI